ncbi:MAG TPA: DMT family transporter [Burkholderiales bacterium]|jgi:drug/metabolite transporter (DMT)-like permease|nr:DMT family transporter [Burkholderiales bacterium]
MKFLRAPSPYLLLSLTALFWAGNWVIGRAMRHDMPPVAMGFWRWTLALLLLLPFTAPELWRQRAVVRRHWITLAALGCLGAIAFNTLIYVGLQYTAATNGVLFNSLSPVFILLLAGIVLREPISGLQVAGMVLSLSGVLAIVARGDPALLAAFHFNPGDLWLITAMFLWAVYTLVLRRRPSGLSATAFLAAMLMLSLPFLLPFYLREYAQRGGFELNRATLAALAYYCTVPSIIAYLFWNRGVAQVGAAKAGLFVHLMPLFGALLSVAFLGERLYAYHFAGAALIFGGIWLTTRTRGRPVNDVTT